MTQAARPTEEELGRIAETVEAWGAVVDGISSNDVGFRLATKPGYAFLDDDSAVIARVLLALPSDGERTTRWIGDQVLPEGLWLDLEARNEGEGEEGPLLSLWMRRSVGDPLPTVDARHVATDVARSWFAFVGGERVAMLNDVVTAMGLTTWGVGGDVIDLSAGGVNGMAYIKDSGDRVRVHTFLGQDVDPDEAAAWVEHQRASAAGQLQMAFDPDVETSACLLRFTADRPLDPAQISGHDAYSRQAEQLFMAWQTRGIADLASPNGGVPSPVVDPVSIEPANAWLLYGDNGSFPTADELSDVRADAQSGINDYLWTTAKQTQPGDLLFMYFVHERKAIHFVARAVAPAWFSGDIETAAHVRPTQWWTYITPPVAVTPIPLAQLREAFNGDLVMRGRSGRYIPPEVAARLIDKIDPDATPGLRRLLHIPVGLADLPKPAQTTFEQWRAIASGSLPLEAKVEEHLVEPLFRLALKDHAAFSLQKRFAVAGGIADYAILKNSMPCAIIEVKVAVRRRPNLSWVDSPDFQQTRRYADALGSASILMDSNFVHLIAPLADAPFKSIERRTATAADLEAITRHISSEAALPDSRT